MCTSIRSRRTKPRSSRCFADQPARRQPSAHARRISRLPGSRRAPAGRRARTDHDDALGGCLRRRNSVGRPLPNIRKYILAGLAGLAETRETDASYRSTASPNMRRRPNPETRRRTSSGSHRTRIGRCVRRRIWTEFKGNRGTKSKPIPGPHLVYGFQTTSPNAVVNQSILRRCR